MTRHIHPMDEPYQAYQDGLNDGRAEAAHIEEEMHHVQKAHIELQEVVHDWLTIGEFMIDPTKVGEHLVLEKEDIAVLVRNTKIALGKAI